MLGLAAPAARRPASAAAEDRRGSDQEAQRIPAPLLCTSNTSTVSEKSETMKVNGEMNPMEQEGNERLRPAHVVREQPDP